MVTTPQASRHATDRIVAPPYRALDAGLRPGPFPDRAASLLPGLLAATRTGLPPAGDDELTNTKIHHGTTSRLHLPPSWAHITDRYHVLGSRRGCVAEVFAVLKPGSNSQRLFQLVVVGIGPSGGQLPADGDGLLDRGQRLLPPPQVGQPDRQVVQRRGQVGPERVRAGRGQLPVDGRRPPGSRPAPPPAAPGRPAGPTGCSATWPGRAGTRPGGPRPAPGRW